MRIGIFLSCVFLLGPGLAAQDLTVEIGEFEKAEVIRLSAQAEGHGGWTEERQETLDRSRRGAIQGYDLYYGYEQSSLIPRSEDFCYLHVFIGDPREGAVSGVRRVWHQKYLLTVTGEFVDQAVTLPVKVAGLAVPRTGTIEVIAHNPYPVNVVLLQHPEGLEIQARSNVVSEHDIYFANRSACCEIQLVKFEVPGRDDSLWSTLEIKENDRTLQPDQAKSYQPWLSLRLQPRSSQAFWASFAPYDSQNPHADLRFNIFFKVKNGREARLQQVVRVRFLPPLPLVVLSTILGAVLAAVLGLLVTGTNQGSKLIFGSAITWSSKAGEVAKRITLSVAVALVIFFLFLLIKGDKRVILFDYSLDPTQCMPAFLIGLLVGSKPAFYYRKLMQWTGKSGGRGKTGTLVLLGIALTTLATVPLAASEASFRPISLDYDAATDTFYTLSSPENRIYRLEAATGRFLEAGNLGPLGTSFDSCLIRWRGAPWVASAEGRLLGLSGASQLTLALTPGGGGDAGPRRQIIGFGRFQGIAFDEAHSRLLLTDRLREGIYAATLDAQGIGEPKLILKHRLLSEPTAIAVRGEAVFVASRKNQAVYRADLAKRTVTPLVRDVLEPAGLAISPDGTRLVVADAGEARIQEYLLASGILKTFLDGSPLREPRGVQIDRRGNVWVSDAWSRAILEFSPRGELLHRYAPRK